MAGCEAQRLFVTGKRARIAGEARWIEREGKMRSIIDASSCGGGPVLRGLKPGCLEQGWLHAKARCVLSGYRRYGGYARKLARASGLVGFKARGGFTSYRVAEGGAHRVRWSINRSETRRAVATAFPNCARSRNHISRYRLNPP